MPSQQSKISNIHWVENSMIPGKGLSWVRNRTLLARKRAIAFFFCSCTILREEPTLIRSLLYCELLWIPFPILKYPYCGFTRRHIFFRDKLNSIMRQKSIQSLNPFNPWFRQKAIESKIKFTIKGLSFFL